MTYRDAIEAERKAIGRPWDSADSAELKHFEDCWRATLLWTDGAAVYQLFDAKPDALAFLDRLRFWPLPG